MKKSKSFILFVLGFLLMGVSLFLIGGTLAGWDILGWFSTSTAMLIYCISLIMGMLMLMVWWKGRNER